MDCYIVTSIIIPLVSAMIGGGFTLLGVRNTIKAQKKEESNNRRLAAKPWIFNYGERVLNRNLISKSYRMEVSGTYNLTSDEDKHGTVCIIKNSDNGIALLDCVKTENNTYYPTCGHVIDKNAVVEVKILWAMDGTETLKEIYLFIKDIYGNKYKHKITQARPYAIIGDCEDV